MPQRDEILFGSKFEIALHTRIGFTDDCGLERLDAWIRATFTGLAETIRAEAIVDVDEINRRRMVGVVALGLLDSATLEPLFEWTPENLARLRGGNWPFIAEAYGAIMALSIAPSLEDSKSGAEGRPGAEAPIPPDDPPPQ